MRHFPSRLTLKSISDSGVFEGYASLFHREDLGRDVILPGAFAESLRKRGARGIRMLYQHDPHEPIGVWEILREDAKGLFVRGRLITDVARGRETLALLKEGALDGLSIGFKAISARRDAKSGRRHIAKVDLWEISVVTFPMLPEARIAALKARHAETHSPAAEEFERWLNRQAGLTRSETRAFLAYGLKGLSAVHSAATDHARR
jgi:uncharacterized protein